MITKKSKIASFFVMILKDKLRDVESGGLMTPACAPIGASAFPSSAVALLRRTGAEATEGRDE
jgi:hypothetical protein